MQSFKTVGNKKDILLPNKDALYMAMEIAVTQEAADYLCDRFKAVAEAAGVFEECSDIYNGLLEFRRNIYLQREIQGEPWSGRANIGDGFFNLQTNSAKRAAKEISTAVDDTIQVDFAISDDSQVLRGYAAHGEALDSGTTRNIDTLFNSYLALSDARVITKDSILYKADAQGNVILNENGEPVKANVFEVNDIIDKGLQEYFNNYGLEVDINKRPFPTEKPIVTPKAIEKVEPEIAEPSKHAKPTEPTKIKKTSSAKNKESTASETLEKQEAAAEAKKSKGGRKHSA